MIGSHNAGVQPEFESVKSASHEGKISQLDENDW